MKLSPPKWYSPFFLTTDYSYAEKYSDYGVYTITLKGEAKSKILDFSKDSDVKKLKWPRELIDDIKTGKSDLNGIAYDMYILAGYGHSQEVFDKSWHLSDAAYDFDVRSKNIFSIVPKHASWASEKDHRFLLQMWKDIHDAGFDGFTHIEFGKKILALFDFKCMDKISIKPVKASVNEKLKSRALRKAFKAKGQAAFPEIKSNDEIVFVSGIPKDKALQLLKRACHDVSNFHESLNEDGAQYKPPYTLEQIKAHYPENIYVKLASDPVHRWRAETGIELIHKEPTEEELDRIWKNWQLMPQEMKDISDKKSIEMFGCTNAEHYNKLKTSEDHLNENKAAYLQKYRDESDVKSIVDMFWSIRNRLSAPQNDIDWWIKKPFNDLKSFVQNFDTSNKR